MRYVELRGLPDVAPGPRTTRSLIYGRVSTAEQDFSRQEAELRDYAGRQGWEVVDFIGSYQSGGSNDSDLNRIKELASRGRFDVLMVWELSRLSRKGPGAILSLVQQFEAWGVRVWSRQETWLNVDGPARELLIAIFGWVAKWEREMISARTRSALAQRRALGIKLGRPKGSRDKHPRRGTLRNRLDA